ncbi:MAG: diguanylate cyclase [Deltaproteobacteria bacterium]|nr:diguanylate cyclase [Deltaproteobacteria bacterium]MCB9787556.1 diguanylate cyclase [Deltaproteobacteria bacterium]
MSEGAACFRARLASLRRRYVDELPERLALVEAGVEAMVAGADAELLGTLRRHVHGLCGSGATFGFRALSERARTMESLLVEASRDGDLLSVEALRAAWEALRAAAEEAIASDPSAVGPSASAGSRELPVGSVWLVDPTGELDGPTAQQLVQHGFNVERFATSAEVLERATPASAAAVIVEAGRSSARFEGLALAEALRAQGATGLRFVFLGEGRDMDARLRGLRAGGVGWLESPPGAEPLIDLLDRVVERGVRAPYRALIIEDDPDAALATRSVLARAGFEAFVVGPEHLLTALETLAPDVVVTALELGTCKGSELVAIIRQEPLWVGLPIVYLTDRWDEELEHEAMLRGADAFLTRPVADQRLVEVLSARACRARLVRQQLLRDSLTGTLNHAALMSALGSEIAGATRRGATLAFAMFDLDRFKLVNDRHGHAVGDRVLRTFAHLLRQRLRAGDTIGRYGGEEFGIVLPDISAAGAMQLVDALRQAFAETEHAGESGTFRVTVSAGIATCPEYATATTIRDAADAALYRAKRSGRDRVVLAR